MKNWMKKGLALCLTLVMCLSLAACGGTGTTEDTTDETVDETPVEESINVRVAALKGPTAMGMVKLMSDSDAAAESGEETAGNTYDFTRGIDVLVPGEEDIEEVNRVIYEELCRGIISPDSRAEYVRIIETLKEKGAEGVILGCTEIGLLVRQEDSPLPVFDTTVIHATRAALTAIS